MPTITHHECYVPVLELNKALNFLPVDEDDYGDDNAAARRRYAVPIEKGHEAAWRGIA